MLKELADEILYENLCQEVEIYYNKTYDAEQSSDVFQRWKAKDPTLPVNLWPRIICSTDMGSVGKSVQADDFIQVLLAILVL